MLVSRPETLAPAALVKVPLLVIVPIQAPSLTRRPLASFVALPVQVPVAALVIVPLFDCTSADVVLLLVKVPELASVVVSVPSTTTVPELPSEATW